MFDKLPVPPRVTDHYRDPNVSQNTSTAGIKKAYGKLAFFNYPDKKAPCKVVDVAVFRRVSGRALSGRVLIGILTQVADPNSI